MLSNQIKSVISIINGGVKGGEVTLADGFDAEMFYPLAKHHQIFGIVLSGLTSAGLASDAPVMKKLFTGALAETVFHEQQASALNKVFSVFDREAVSYMPLKGTLLKRLYPRPELRVMSDADILIKTEEYGKIRAVLTDLGYTETYESDHEIVWKKQGITLELHKHLIPSYNTEYFAYFGTGWERAVKDEKGYRLSQNDEFIFVFTHFAKHYRDGGIGIKHLVDLWLILQNYDLDLDYVIGELKKMRLDIFFKNVQNTLAVWFDGQESDEVTGLITETVINSGAYGTSEDRKSAGSVRASEGHAVGSRKAKLAVLRKMFFPPVSSLKDRYTYLTKAPLLLPFAWLCRIAYAVTHNGRLSRSLTAFRKTSSKQAVTMEQSLKTVGLDFKQ